MPAPSATATGAEPALASITLLERQGLRRRRQLVQIAARLIEIEGVEAVRIPRVAELAGIGRTALYRYFPRREDLLDAVFADFDERLREKIGPGEFALAIDALREGSSDVMPPSTARLFEAIWDVLDECGPAGLILRAHATAVDVESGVDDRDRDESAGDRRAASATSDRFRARWIEGGLSGLEATLISDTANAILTRLYFSARRGLIARDAALRLGYRALVGLVRGLSEPGPA